MTSLLDGARNLVSRTSDVGARVTGLETAVTHARGRLDDALVDDGQEVVDRASSRLRLAAEHTVIAIAGATGSGKSSTFNALTGLELSAVGVRRPTTSWTTACVWGTHGATELLEWLGIPARHQITRDSMLDTGREDKRLDGTVLLDLPDHDSTEVSHHLEVDRLVKLADLLVWVLDPQKYADAAIHDRYLKPLAGHADVMLVVLNHIDTVPEDRRDAMLADVRRLLDLDGLGKVPVLGISARHGIGMEALKDEMAKRASSKKATRAKLEADVKDAAAAMAAVSGSGKPSNASKDRAAELEEAFADAAGVPLVVDAVAASTRLRARRATGWPVTAWLSRLKPDPLKRLHLDLGKEGRALTRASRTSVPPADPGPAGPRRRRGAWRRRRRRQPAHPAVAGRRTPRLGGAPRRHLRPSRPDPGADRPRCGEAAVVGRPGPGAAVGADPRRGRGRGLAGIPGGDGLPPGAAAVAAVGGRDPGADVAADRGSGARDPARAVLPSARLLHRPGAGARGRQAAALPGSAAWSPTWSSSRSTWSSRPTTRSGTGSTTRCADRPSGSRRAAVERVLAGDAVRRPDLVLAAGHGRPTFVGGSGLRRRGCSGRGSGRRGCGGGARSRAACRRRGRCGRRRPRGRRRGGLRTRWTAPCSRRRGRCAGGWRGPCAARRRRVVGCGPGRGPRSSRRGQRRGGWRRTGQPAGFVRR